MNLIRRKRAGDECGCDMWFIKFNWSRSTLRECHRSDNHWISYFWETNRLRKNSNGDISIEFRFRSIWFNDKLLVISWPLACRDMHLTNLYKWTQHAIGPAGNRWSHESCTKPVNRPNSHTCHSVLAELQRWNSTRNNWHAMPMQLVRNQISFQENYLYHCISASSQSRWFYYGVKLK